MDGTEKSDACSAASSSVKVTRKQLRSMLEFQEFRCALTGQQLTPDDAEVDHVNPRMAGGGDTLDNLQWLRRDVNRAKGTMSNDEFVAMCVAVAKHSGGLT